MKNKYLKLAVVAGLVVLADQITKALIFQNLPYHQSITVIAGFFDLTHIHNPGGAFGLMADMSETVRTLVFLYLEDKDYREISETLGISEVNARVKMNRVKNKLRTILNP